jgi:hypothetical protein
MRNLARFLRAAKNWTLEYPKTGSKIFITIISEHSMLEKKEIINEVDMAQNHGSSKMFDETDSSIIAACGNMNAAVKIARTPHGTNIDRRRVAKVFHPVFSEIL